MNYDLDYFRGRLRIDRHRLDDELELQADHMDRIGSRVAQATRAEAFARRSFEREEASLIKDMCAADHKMPMARASVEVKLKREWDAQWSIYQEKKEELMLWESLQKSWYQRGFDLKALGDLYAHQYFVVDTLHGKTEKKHWSEEPAAVAIFERKRQLAAERRSRIDEPQPSTSGRVKLNG